MGFLFSLIFFMIGISSALIALVLLQPDAVFNLINPLPPKKDVFPYESRVWSSSKSGKIAASTEIRPFKVEYPEADLEDLKRRLRDTRYGPPLEDVKFTYGFPSEQLNKVRLTSTL